MKQTILAVSPYVIDLPLSIGGTLALHARAGDDVYALAMCYPGLPNGVIYPESRNPENPFKPFDSEKDFKEKVADVEKDAVAAALGIKEFFAFDYQPHAEALFEREVVDRTVEIIDRVQPDAIITYWPVTNYTDFSGATMAVTRAITERKLKKVPRLLFSETLTSKHTLCFHPDQYVDITPVVRQKREATRMVWEGQAVDYFYNVFSLPTSDWRGRECGVPHAEAFVTLHGGFGEIKRINPLESGRGADPYVLTRAQDLLAMHKRVPYGVYPFATGASGVLDTPTAEKVFYIPRAET